MKYIGIQTAQKTFGEGSELDLGANMWKVACYNKAEKKQKGGGK